MANGSNKMTDAAMVAEATKLGTAYGEGKDAWPMLFQKFAAWGQEGVVSPEVAKNGSVDKVKTLVAEFLTAAKKAQILALSTISNKETEMRVAVELGVHCDKVKVDAVKLIMNVRDACAANRKAKVPTMQTLNAFTDIARKYTDEKKPITKLLTTADLQPMVKAPPKKAPPKVIDVWKKEARTLGLLTGLVTPETADEKRRFAKKDLDENSAKVAAAVISYVTKMTEKKPAKSAAK